MHGQLVGTVSYSHPSGKFHFIKRDDGGPDTYLGIGELQQAGLAPPKRGDRLRFDTKAGSGGKLRAVNVARLDS